jgi:hypothetical protein
MTASNKATDRLCTTTNHGRPRLCENASTVEEQHMEVDIEVQGTAEALDQGDRARLGRLVVRKLRAAAAAPRFRFLA